MRPCGSNRHGSSLSPAGCSSTAARRPGCCAAAGGHGRRRNVRGWRGGQGQASVGGSEKGGRGTGERGEMCSSGQMNVHPPQAGRAATEKVGEGKGDIADDPCGSCGHAATEKVGEGKGDIADDPCG
eukprot:356058-Chlamydomonas_euryale.AAC.13